MSISLSEVPFEQAVFFKFFPFKAFGELAIPQGRPWILEPGVICGHLVTLAWKYAIFKILSCEVSSWQVKSGDTVTKEGDGRQGDRWGNLFSKPALCPVCKITAAKAEGDSFWSHFGVSIRRKPESRGQSQLGTDTGLLGQAHPAL